MAALETVHIRNGSHRDAGPEHHAHCYKTAALAAVKDLESAWESDRPLGMLLFYIEHFFTFERVYGDDVCDHCRRTVEATLKKACGQSLGNSEFTYTEPIEDGGVILFFRTPSLTLQTLADLAATFRLDIRRSLNKELVKLTGQNLEVKAGYAQIRPRKDRDRAELLYQALCDAREVAAGAFNITKLRLMEEFRRVIETPRLTAVYMPIVDLNDGSVLGWEALARGPVDTRFHSPSVLFDFAEEVGGLFTLERACRQQALRGIGSLQAGQKLFLNIHPHTVGDPNFTAGETKRLLRDHGLHPEQLVFEITERHPIRDFSLFFRTLDHYRSQGYLTAIDDVGAGYSGLWTLAQIRPEYVKVDMSLVRGVDANPVNRALLETLVSFADKIGSRIIAEGIETETELTSLMDMGVHYGQGFFLARPARPKPSPERSLPVRPRVGSPRVTGSRCSVPVGELVEPAIRMEPDVRIADVQTLLESGPPTPISGVVVARENRPLGLIMSHDLNRQLGTLYGVALYYQRPISRLMDTSPLILEDDVPVEIAAEQAMARPKYKVYDHIIVTRKRELVGVVSVQKMLDALARVQVEMAKGANPLTGFPGNVVIEREFEERARAGRPFSLIYADLDHFKVYNDKYGFENGDRMLLLLSRIMAWALNRHGNGDGFLGHIGGDDFVIICSPQNAERVCTSIIRCFKRLAPTMYDREDREQGYITGRGRDGDVRSFSITSVSLAIVDCEDMDDPASFAQRAAQMKKYAKSKPGNVFVRDRRERDTGEETAF